MLLLNAFSLNMIPAEQIALLRIEPIGLEEARSALAGGFTSAVGHESTAAIFSEALGLPVETRRATVMLEPGVPAIVGQYRGPRLPEGATTLPEGGVLQWVRVTLELTPSAPSLAGAIPVIEDPLAEILKAYGNGRPVLEEDEENVRAAAALGAPRKVLVMIRDADVVSRSSSIVLPPHHYEGLSRGRGWARMGQGNAVAWGKRVRGGYEVEEPGRWVVGGNDGFTRKAQDEWNVMHIQVGNETWTIADRV